MVADLLSQRLDPDMWGHKAARLSQVVDLGLPVPPGLCLSTAALAHGTSEAIASLRTWLELYRPRRVVVRTSSALEDGLKCARAGRSLSLLNCPPDASALARVIDQDLFTQEDLEAESGGCVLVQEQVAATLYGVAFQSQDRLLVEASQRPDGATSGMPLRMRARRDTRRFRASTGTELVPSLNLTAQLHSLCRQLSAHFGFDVDVEWAWTGAMVLVLQVRPITRAALEWAS